MITQHTADKGRDMLQVNFRRVPEAEKDIFTQYFQDYMGELARLNGVKPNRRGLYEYG